MGKMGVRWREMGGDGGKWGGGGMRLVLVLVLVSHHLQQAGAASPAEPLTRSTHSMHAALVTVAASSPACLCPANSTQARCQHTYR